MEEDLGKYISCVSPDNAELIWVMSLLERCRLTALSLCKLQTVASWAGGRITKVSVLWENATEHPKGNESSGVVELWCHLPVRNLQCFLPRSHMHKMVPLTFFFFFAFIFSLNLFSQLKYLFDIIFALKHPRHFEASLWSSLFILRRNCVLIEYKYSAFWHPQLCDWIDLSQNPTFEYSVFYSDVVAALHLFFCIRDLGSCFGISLFLCRNWCATTPRCAWITIMSLLRDSSASQAQ